MNRQLSFSVKQVQHVRMCAYLVLVMGFFNLVFLCSAEVLKPWLYTDVLAEELQGLDCRDEAASRIQEYLKRTTINRMVFPGLIGAILLFSGAIIVLKLRPLDGEVSED
ncbi:MAG: hypothetical protein Tsb009_14110 [Planctomycetaceae bacterium]